MSGCVFQEISLLASISVWFLTFLKLFRVLGNKVSAAVQDIASKMNNSKAIMLSLGFEVVAWKEREKKKGRI